MVDADSDCNGHTLTDESQRLEGVPEIEVEVPKPLTGRDKNISKNEIKRSKQRDKIDKELTLEYLKDFEIKKVIGHRRKGKSNRWEYQVTYTNYPDIDWLPRRNFNSIDCLEDYWKANATAKNSDRPKEFRSEEIPIIKKPKSRSRRSKTTVEQDIAITVKSKRLQEQIRRKKLQVLITLVDPNSNREGTSLKKGGIVELNSQEGF
jgi:hypothetical protein